MILVTGGLGYIGSHTVVELINSGYLPMIIDNLSNSNFKILNQIKKITNVDVPFFNFDLCNESEVNEFFDRYPEIENIIHFVAFKSVGQSLETPLKYYKNNIYPLINLLQIAQERKLNIVFSSSCTVYGKPDILPVSESSEIKKPSSVYANTKKIGEEILKDESVINKNLKVIALRYFNPVGAHSSGLIGELPNGVPQNLVPFITQTAIGKRNGLKIFGNDYQTLDGTCIRDYIHVVDLAKAHILAIKKLQETDLPFDIYNIGTGQGYSVLEVIQTFESVSNTKLHYSFTDRRPGDIMEIYSDVTKARDELKFQTELDLTEMLSSAWKWEIQLKENFID